MKRSAAAFFVFIGVAGFSLYAEVTSFTAKNTGSRTRLTSVTVDRGGKQAIFDAERLIPVRITHFKADSTRIAVVPAGAPIPEAGERDSLLGLDLNAGLINLGGQARDLDHAPVLAGAEATPGLAIAFEHPVVNMAGGDVVLFELQTRANSPLAGDPIRIAPLEWRDGLHAIVVDAYDIQFDHPKAKDLRPFELLTAAEPPSSLDALQRGALHRGGASSGFKALAVAIDLTDLGYADGEEVSQIFLQNVAPGEPAVDPVCVAGLPAPEEPNVLHEEPRTLEDDPSLLIEQFLALPEADFEEIVFAVRSPGTDHWYANFGYYSAPGREYPPQRAPDGVTLPAIYKDGGRLCALNLRTGALRVLLEDLEGAIRDPQVHYEGEKIVFSYRRGRDPYFHLYEIGADGASLKQITDGPYNDIEPAYLPDGGIVFCSDRCRRFVNCWISPVATLHRCEIDGSGLRMISTNIEHDNTPWVLPDGRILYMRWEYVDRSQSHFHHLWTANPDGTGQMVYYGNQNPGITMIDAKPIPDTNMTVASFSPSHGRPEHAGYLTRIDPALGPDAEPSAVRISSGEPVFRDPYPLSRNYFLAARNDEILLMQDEGITACLFKLGEKDSGRFCHEPRPLRPRKRERVIPPRVDLAAETGRLFLTDIYEGRNMQGVERAEIKELLVLEQLPKPVNFSGGMWPISIGGTFTLARILGTVPVETDGSAYFDIPAMRSVFFVALDKDRLAVKRMQSFLSTMPGETTSCVGCHEGRLTTPPYGAARLAAMQRPPSTIRPLEDVPEVMDYPRDIQPILDKHCVPCHNPGRLEGGADLTGDHTPLFSQSYWTMMEHGLISDGRNETYGNRPPRTIGSSASRLMKKIDGGHHGVNVSPREHNMIRLWIESSVPYAGTYAALGSGMFPVEFPISAIERRCGACHGSPPPAQNPITAQPYFRFSKAGPAYPLVHTFMGLQEIRAKMGYYKFGNGRPPQSFCNITRPHMSLLLRAPLSKEAGGLQRCGEAVFTGDEDPDYQAILAAIQTASAQEAVEKRFDMPGFRPNDYYLYQMQRYGVLPADLSNTGPIDPYAVDQAYWRQVCGSGSPAHHPGSFETAMPGMEGSK